MRFHVVSLAHTNTTRDFHSCAYTNKVRNFCRMMLGRGHQVFLYSGELNDALCSQHFACISEATRVKAQGSEHYTSLSWDPTTPLWRAFNTNVVANLRQHIEPHDFICVIGGTAHKPIAAEFPHHIVVEFGVGYGGTFAQYRVFESYAWMHTVYGAQSGGNAHAIDGCWYDAVIPGYLDPDEFPLQTSKGDHLLFLGRITDRKGIHVAIEVAKASGRQLRVAGTGDAPTDPCVQFLGEATLETRAGLLGEAAAVLMPTLYIEPFGNVAVEAMMCGTPVIATDWGAFTETVRPGVGYRCRNLREFVVAVNNLDRLWNAPTIRGAACSIYGLEAAGLRYEQYFLRLEDLWTGGWYAL